MRAQNKNWVSAMIVVGLVSLVCGVAFAATYSFPTYNQTAQSVFELGLTPINFNVNISSNGATTRTQLPSNVTSSCTVQAASGNAGSVFVGGATVTNSSGVNEGIVLAAGDALGPITVTNSNLIYVSAGTANDDVKVFCN